MREGSTREIVERVREEAFGTICLEKRGCARSKERRERIRTKIAKPGQPGYDIKTDVVVLLVVVFNKFSLLYWLELIIS